MIHANNEPKRVDVLVPVYNQKKLVEKTLDSILNQDYKNYRIIISDDFSQDGTQEILKNYRNSYPDKIVLLLNNSNIGITANLKKLISVSDSQYVVFFSGDDLMMPNRISRQVEELEKNPNFAGSMSDVFVYHERSGKKIFYRNKDFSSQNPRRIIGTRNQIPSCSVMINRNVYGEIDQDYRTPIVGDWLMVNEIAIKGMIYIREPLTIYRRHDSNITQRGVDKMYLDDRLVATDLLFSKYKKYYWALRKARSNIFISAAIRFYHEKMFKNTVKFLLLSFFECPINIEFIKLPFLFLKNL